MKRIFLFLILAVAAFQTAGAQKHRIIFETDMGNDIDDAIALDVICKGLDEGKFKLLGVSTHREGAAICPFVDALLTWYGYPNIPIAKSPAPKPNPYGGDTYVGAVEERRTSDGRPYYKHSKHESDFKDAIEFYRKTLSRQPDKSVTIVSVGFATNLALLLDSKPDKYSPLTGRELVAKKVKLLSTMMGHTKNRDYAEFNVLGDIPAMQKLMAEWPTEVALNAFEVGELVKFPSDIMNSRLSWAPDHPLVAAYNRYNPNPHDQLLWDILSVVYVTNPEMFDLSGRCTVSVTDKGTLRITPSATGNVRYFITTPEQNLALQNMTIEITAKKPKNFKK